MPKGYKQMLAEAEAEVRSLDPADVARLAADPNVTVVDIRDPRELEREGLVPGSFHAPRGMLEFWIDPESPYHKPVFAEKKTFVFYCAGGMRSLLATKLAQDMGLDAVDMKGGFAAWKAAGLDVATKEAKPAKG